MFKCPDLQQCIYKTLINERTAGPVEEQPPVSSTVRSVVQNPARLLRASPQSAKTRQVLALSYEFQEQNKRLRKWRVPQDSNVKGREKSTRAENRE